MPAELPQRIDYHAGEKPGLPIGTTAKDIIAATRDGRILKPDEIRGFVNDIVADKIPDYQTTAWLMAVRLKGLTAEETIHLTQAMAASGEILDLSDISEVRADKHSSGGVGDKTTFLVISLVAACGIPVAKMSGRGLGHTGGTIDKFESIPGIRTEFTTDEFRNQFAEIGLVLAGQSADLAPADGKLYTLRDVTGTISSPPLIASSIMSKKIASGSNVLVLDVKAGKAAFMQTVEEAQNLARMMVDIGKAADIKCKALISDMNQPLGEAVGNALEVEEAIETLRGEGPVDLTLHCLDTAAHMVHMAEGAESFDEAKVMVSKTIEDGTALEKFAQLIHAQGGDRRVVDSPKTILPQALFEDHVTASEGGYVAGIDPLIVGETVMRMGGGRQKKGDTIDPAVGVMVLSHVGSEVASDQNIFTVYANDESRLQEATSALLEAVSISADQVDPLPHTYGIVE